MTERDQFKRFLVRRLQHHAWGKACLPRFFPPGRAQAPAIALVQSREIIFGPWRGQIIAHGLGKSQELIGNRNADGVNRSEESRVGKECVSKGRSGWSP